MKLLKNNKFKILIIIITIILLLSVSVFIVFKFFVNKEEKNDNINTPIPSLINKELDISVTNEYDNIVINDFIETKEFYLFNLTNNKNETLIINNLKIEFYNESKELVFIEKVNISLEKDNIKTLKINKKVGIEDKIKYIKLVVE